MMKPGFPAQDNQSLQATLAVTLGHIKSLHATLTALMTEVAAVRRTVLEAPEAMAEYRKNLQSALETAKPLVDEAMSCYDDMIDQVAGYSEWEN
jgi:uncharacterized protein involved in exopolysaccharide biosynthesis